MITKPFCKRGHEIAIVGRTNAGICRECHREDNRQWQKDNPSKLIKHGKENNWKRYGILNEDGSQFITINWDRAYQMQQGNCKICGMHQSKLDKPLYADHNHETGIFRGLICDDCNKLLGFAGDMIEVLENAIKYLKGN